MKFKLMMLSILLLAGCRPSRPVSGLPPLPFRIPTQGIERDMTETRQDTSRTTFPLRSAVITWKTVPGMTVGDSYNIYYSPVAANLGKWRILTNVNFESNRVEIKIGPGFVVVKALSKEGIESK